MPPGISGRGEAVASPPPYPCHQGSLGGGRRKPPSPLPIYTPGMAPVVTATNGVALFSTFIRGTQLRVVPALPVAQPRPIGVGGPGSGGPGSGGPGSGGPGCGGGRGGADEVVHRCRRGRRCLRRPLDAAIPGDRAAGGRLLAAARAAVGELAAALAAVGRRASELVAGRAKSPIVIRLDGMWPDGRSWFRCHVRWPGRQAMQA